MRTFAVGPVEAGDLLSAERDAEIVALLHGHSGPGGLEQAGSYTQIRRPPKGPQWVELTEALTYPADTQQPPYTDDAKRLFHNHSTDYYPATTVKPWRIYMPGAPWNGSAYIGQPKLKSGIRALVLYNRQSDRWEIKSLNPHQARWIKFSATEDFTSGESNVTVDGLTYYDGHTPDPEPSSVENPGWAGLDNDVGLAFLNINDYKYYIVSMITVATDIMVGHRIDDSNNKKFETLWRKFHMRAAETTTSDWRTDHTGADCS